MLRAAREKEGGEVAGSGGGRVRVGKKRSGKAQHRAPSVSSLSPLSPSDRKCPFPPAHYSVFSPPVLLDLIPPSLAHICLLTRSEPQPE